MVTFGWHVGWNDFVYKECCPLRGERNPLIFLEDLYVYIIAQITFVCGLWLLITCRIQLHNFDLGNMCLQQNDATSQTFRNETNLLEETRNDREISKNIYNELATKIMQNKSIGLFVLGLCWSIDLFQ